MNTLPMLVKRLSLVAALALTAPAFAAQQFGIGIHIGQSTSQIEAALKQGPFSYRTDAEWRWFETTKGVLTYPSNLTGWLDPITTVDVGAGASPLIVLDYGNSFYDSGGEPYSAAGIAAFAKYAGFVAGHYKGKVSQFEVWNEWNLAGSDTNASAGTATAYVALLKATYAAVKAANPSATVVAGSGVANLDTTWVTQFISAGGLNYTDAFSIHPYVHSRARKPSAPTLSSLFSLDAPLSFIQTAEAQTSSVVGGTPEDSFVWVDKVHSMLASAMPSKTIPIFITEIGWATNTGQYGFSQPTQAAYLQRYLLLAHARSYVGGVWWYDIIDDGADNTNYFQRFGLLTQSGSQKQAYGALMQIKDELLSPAIATQGTGPNGEITITGTLASGQQYYAAWLPTDNFDTTVSSSTATSMLSSGYNSAVAASTSTSTLSAAPLVLVQ